MLKIFAAFLTVIGLLFGVFFQSSSLDTHSLFFTKGNSLYETVRSDKSFGDAPAFFIIEKIDRIKQRINTGEFLIHKGESAFSVIKKMISGEKVIRKITIPEGYTVKMIIDKLYSNDLLKGDIEGEIAEGSLMPDTYYCQFNDSRISIISKMKNNMDKYIAELKTKNHTNLTVEQVVTLASIVEKETGNQNEIGLVASVFHNRLAKKMRLQSDPTIIYALSDKYGKIDRKLTRKDLLLESEYNTYRKNGLTPTAICCPGKKAIEAVLNPPKTDFLYFVAHQNEKEHRFSKNYDDHLKNVKLRKNNAHNVK